MTTKACFVAMPFDGSCDSAYYQAILPACAELAIKCEGFNDDLTEKNIIKQIVTSIYNADIVIANITGSNPNVFYELGISHTLPYSNKAIVIAKNGSKIPFDIHSFRIILYHDTSDGLKLLKQQLKERMSGLIERSDNSSNPVRDNIDYFEGFILTQNDATERHMISLDKALESCKHTLILIGTTLFSARNQLAKQIIKEKIKHHEFRELSLVIRDIKTADVGKDIRRHLNEFVKDEGIKDLFELNSDYQKLSLYFCQDFLRFSATYIDHLEDYGKIRVTHSIYGSLMEHSPSYLLTKKRSLKLYEGYVKAWEDLKSRTSTIKVSNLGDFEAYTDGL